MPNKPELLERLAEEERRVASRRQCAIDGQWYDEEDVCFDPYWGEDGVWLCKKHYERIHALRKSDRENSDPT